jgi:abhydrolase domain-containing protein 12
LESLKTSKKDVIIYFHGNSGSRAGEHRKELYLLLQSQDYHVVCFDYRGYADSTECAPSETGTVTDGLFVYRWVRNLVGTNNQASIFVWGHSLGTGVSSHVVANLCAEGNPPCGLILEAPFTNLGEEVRCHMLTAIYRILPYFDYIFTYPLKKNDMEFQSDRHIAGITIPIVILHALDDPVIPFFLAQKLFKIGYETRPESAKPIYFKDFGEGYAHKYICRAPELSEIINDFVVSAKTDNWPCQSLEASSLALMKEISTLG